MEGLVGWYSVRCVLAWRGGVYEERISLWEAESLDMAIAMAEAEAAEYCGESDHQYTGLAQAYHISDERPGSGDEVFSLLRNSSLAPERYIDRFFDTRCERQQRE